MTPFQTTLITLSKNKEWFTPDGDNWFQLRCVEGFSIQSRRNRVVFWMAGGHYSVEFESLSDVLTFGNILMGDVTCDLVPTT